MKLRYIAATLCISAVAFTGCSTSNEVQPEIKQEVAKQEVAKQEETKQEETKQDEAVTDMNIVSATVAATQVLDKLETDLVGVPNTKYTLPTRYDGVTQIGQAMSPDFEIIASLDPDLVVIDSMFKENVEKSMNEFGMEAFYFNTSTYTNFLGSIEELGQVIGKEEEAKALISELEGVEEVVKSKIKGEAPTVAVLFGGGENFMLATDNSYLGDLVDTAGANNITDDLNVESDYIPFSMEQIVASNPDYILRFAHGNLEETKKSFDQAFDKNPAFATLDAVKEGKVIDLDPTIFGVSANIHVVDAIEVLGDILYGE